MVLSVFVNFSHQQALKYHDTMFKYKKFTTATNKHFKKAQISFWSRNRVNLIDAN